MWVGVTFFGSSRVCSGHSIILPLVSPPFHVEKKLQTSEKRPTPVKNASAAPQQVCRSGDPGPWTWDMCWYPLCLHPGTCPKHRWGCRAGKAFAMALLVPMCQGCEGCGAAGLELMVLYLQAAPGPASPGPTSPLSPSEEAQLRLERIFNSSVIPEVLVLVCCLPRNGEVWAACGCPRCAVCSAHSDCTPVSGCQPHGPSLGDTGSREWMTRAVGGFGDHRPD